MEFPACHIEQIKLFINYRTVMQREMKDAYKILVWNLKEKGQLRRPSCTCEDII